MLKNLKRNLWKKLNKEDEMKKVDYSKLTEEKLERRLKELKFEMIKSQTMMGKAVTKKGGKKGGKGSDILKRLRKEVARIKTEQSRRK